MIDRIAEDLVRLRERKPLVHHITNFVVMNDTANVTLAIGGLPVMSHAREEVAEMVAAAQSLVLNPGTLSMDWVESMLIAGKRANELGVPVVLDPVGAGATSFRTWSNKRLMSEIKLSIIKGNPGEIAALAGQGGLVKGVESMVDSKEIVGIAKDLACQFKTVVAVTGQRDIVTDGERVVGVDNGHPMLKTITGTGCSSTTVVAAFAAVEDDTMMAAVAGLVCFGIAAELASEVAKGPASFKVALHDALYGLTPEQVRDLARVTQVV